MKTAIIGRIAEQASTAVMIRHKIISIMEDLRNVNKMRNYHFPIHLIVVK